MTTTHPYLDQGIKILKTRLHSTSVIPPAGANSSCCPFITISREAGAGATVLGQQLVPLLNEQMIEEGRSWIFFDEDLITHALTKHHLPERLAEYLPEDRVSEIKALIDELVGLHPPVWELEHKVSEAIVQLAQLGCVILTGRASNLITRTLPGGLHLRLVAAMEARIQRMMKIKNCDAGMAKHTLLGSDQARSRYAQTNFQQDIEDPHNYDLVINTDLITPACAAHLVMHTLRGRIQAFAPQTAPAVRSPQPAAS